MAEIKTIGILTSGGDAPGMNPAIRAVTRAAIFSGFKVKGIYRGYRGLLTDEIVEFSSRPPDARSSAPPRGVSSPTTICDATKSTRWW